MPATAIAVPLAVPLVAWVVTKLDGYLHSESSLLADVREDVERLMRELERIRGFLSKAVCPEEHWVKEIRDVAYDVEDIVEAYMYRRRYATGLFERLFCRLRYRLQKKIKKIDDKINEIHKSKDRYTTQNGSRSLVAQCSSAFHCYSNAVVGFKEEERKLVENLRNAEPQQLLVMSIVGMGGQGKTTLANQVYYSKEVTKDFPIHVWVNVGVNAEMSVILRKIIKGISGTEANATLTENELSQMLKLLEIQKRYLIVLDDVWEEQVWDRIQRALPEVENGSRVVLTTRSMYVAKYVNRDNILELCFLNETESMDLFHKTIYPNKKDQTLRENVVLQELVKRCHGLPLAIVKLGKYLATKDQYQWSQMIEELNWQLSEVKECCDSLGLSYNYLPDHLKSCFLYLASFPKSGQISARKLVRLWEAEGFHSQEESTDNFLEKLIQRCMVQVAERHYDNSIRKVCVHEIMQELCTAEARKDKFLNVGGRSNHVGEIRRLAVHKRFQGDYRDPSGKWQTPKLRSLLGFNLEEENNVGKSFEGLNLLRVIDLQGVKGLQTLPNEIKNMLFLKYLRLRGCDGSAFLMLDLSNHHYLQTLDANSGKPAMSLSLTGSLRDLQLMRGMAAGKWIETELSNLSSLKKLGIRNITYHYEISLLKALARLGELVSLTLESKMGNGGSIPSDIFTCFGNKHPLLSLKLKGPLSRRDHHLPKSIEFPPRLTKLVLKRTGLKEDPMATLEKLPQLVYLEFSEDAYLGKKMICTKDGFLNLQFMILVSLANLEQLQLNGAMPRLIHLHHVKCPKLKGPSKLLQHVVHIPDRECGVCQTRSEFQRLRGID